MSLPLRFTLYLLATIALVAALTRFFDDILFVGGGLPGTIIVGSLLTLLNLIARPILNALALPLKFLVTLMATILVNGLFMLLIHRFSLLFDASIVTISIGGGILGWIKVAVILGTAHWALKNVLF